MYYIYFNDRDYDCMENVDAAIDTIVELLATVQDTDIRVSISTADELNEMIARINERVVNYTFLKNSFERMYENVDIVRSDAAWSKTVRRHVNSSYGRKRLQDKIAETARMIADVQSNTEDMLTQVEKELALNERANVIINRA